MNSEASFYIYCGVRGFSRPHLSEFKLLWYTTPNIAGFPCVREFGSCVRKFLIGIECQKIRYSYGENVRKSFKKCKLT